MLKLPLILTDTSLYAAAIANFYHLTYALEQALAAPFMKAEPMVVRVHSMGLSLAAGYEADLAQLYGPGWQAAAEQAKTAETTAYCQVLATATPAQLVAAAFILYGALVIGGGKATQKKVKGVFPGCDHVLYDVADEMMEARASFRQCFNEIGAEHLHEYDTLVEEAARFMQLNNTVLLSISCLPGWWWKAAIGMGALCVAVPAVLRARRA
jgi:hypothetical protein